MQLMHYQPYWGQAPGQFARTARYKLYRDGRFFDVPRDLEEKANLDSGNHPLADREKERLLEVLSMAPPAHTEKGSKATSIRPTYSAWGFPR